MLEAILLLYCKSITREVKTSHSRLNRRLPEQVCRYLSEALFSCCQVNRLLKREQVAGVGVILAGSTLRNRSSRAGIKKHLLLPQELVSSVEMLQKENNQHFTMQ